MAACLAIISRRLSSVPSLHRPLAVLFPGQGSQYVGMAQDLFQRFPAAKNTLDHANNILGIDLTEIMFHGPSDELTRTAHAQPAILACSAALLAVLKEEAGFDIPSHADYVMGHSLGEYTALYASGALSFDDALRLVHKRGKAMEACLESSTRTSMVALICRPNKLDQIITHVSRIQSDLAKGEVVAVSNINSSTQAVLSGTHDAVERTCKSLHHHNIATRAVELPVSAPFHCPLMRSAAETMRPFLRATDFQLPKIPVISNVTVTPIQSPSDVSNLLEEQITSTVQWHPSIQYLRNVGRVRDFIAIGPNRVLGNLLRKDWPTDRVVLVDTADEVQAVVEGNVLSV